MCNLHCCVSKERQEIKCQCLCPISWSCLLCKSVEVFNDFSHHHGDTETREALISSLLSFSSFFSLLCLTLWYSSVMSWLSLFMCNVTICCGFVAGTISGAMAQVALSKQGNWLSVCGKRLQGKHQWVLLQQKHGTEMYRQHTPSFWGLLQSVILTSCLCLLVRAPGRLSCFAVYEQLCVQKFTRIYNMMVPCESSVLGTELVDLSI